MFLNILAIMSFCDAMTSLGLFLSVARQLDSDTSTNVCIAQAVFISFFQKASVSWTVALSLQLYSIVKYSKPYFSEVYMHLVFWFVPLIFTLLPIFAGQTFGNSYEQSDAYFRLCFLTQPTLNPNISQIVADIIGTEVFALLSILWLIYLYVSIVKAFNSADPDNKSFFKLREVLNILRLYPLTIIILQLPLLGVLIVDFTAGQTVGGGEIATKRTDIVVSFYYFYSIFTTIIFFYGSKDARDRWRVLFCEFRIDNSLRHIENIRTSLYNVEHANVRFSSSRTERLLSDEQVIGITSREFAITDNDIEECETFTKTNEMTS